MSNAKTDNNSDIDDIEAEPQPRKKSSANVKYEMTKPMSSNNRNNGFFGVNAYGNVPGFDAFNRSNSGRNSAQSWHHQNHM